MALSSDDIFLPDDHCEICGAELSDEVVIQEFADGSIARLCAECAAGAALQPDTAEFRFPDDVPPTADDDSPLDGPSTETALDLGDQPTDAAPASTAAAPGPAPRTAFADLDPLEKTRELLTPVVDLIDLQHEMQGALQRLATSLQTFATGVITEKADTSATVESRLEALEKELEATRTRLHETEALLAASVAGAAATPAATPAAAAPPGRPPNRRPSRPNPWRTQAQRPHRNPPNPSLSGISTPPSNPLPSIPLSTPASSRRPRSSRPLRARPPTPAR